MRPPRPADLALGMFFLPRERAEAAAALVAAVLREQGIHLLAWRRVPLDHEALGDKARATLPDVRQALLARPRGLDDEAFERRLYLARKTIGRRAAEQALEGLYWHELLLRSSRTREQLLPVPEWRTIWLGLEECRISSHAGMVASFLRCRPGRSIPAHTHRGKLTRSLRTNRCSRVLAHDRLSL